MNEETIYNPYNDHNKEITMQGLKKILNKFISRFSLIILLNLLLLGKIENYQPSHLILFDSLLQIVTPLYH